MDVKDNAEWGAKSRWERRPFVGLRYSFTLLIPSRDFLHKCFFTRNRPKPSLGSQTTKKMPSTLNLSIHPYPHNTPTTIIINIY